MTAPTPAPPIRTTADKVHPKNPYKHWLHHWCAPPAPTPRTSVCSIHTGWCKGAKEGPAAPGRMCSVLFVKEIRKDFAVFTFCKGFPGSASVGYTRMTMAYIRRLPSRSRHGCQCFSFRDLRGCNDERL